MTATTITGAPPSRRGSTVGPYGPWLFGPVVDLALFGGSAALGLGLVALRRSLGIGDALPEWGWVVFVLFVDVAHVWSTLFRTYLDPEELRSHRLRYYLGPVVVYLASVGLYLWGSLAFWRALAYLAVFHFIRQQVGWTAVYRARAQQRARVDRLLDEAAVYAATLYPIIYWHTRLSERRFAWFVKGDFVDLSALATVLEPPARLVWGLALAVWALRQGQLYFRTGTIHTGKGVVVLTTAAIWYVGIVATNSDFDFTVTNVIIHGVPYFALLYYYARERRREQPGSWGSAIAARGVGVFLAFLLALAFAEEFLWHRYVFPDHPGIFGAGWRTESHVALAFLVPLLSLPQSFHYALDGLLWRRRDTRRLRAQRAALGFD